MTVGHIISGNPYPEPGQSKRPPSLRLRLLSNAGLYPRGQVHGSKGTYYLDEQLAFIAVRTNEQRALKYWSEVTLLALEEIRLLSAILLSMRPDHGVLHLYPTGAHIIDATGDPAVLYAQARELASKFEKDQSTKSTSISDGGGYRISRQEIDRKRYHKLLAGISIQDHLMLRGLSAILKADMLQVHREFAEEAQSILYIAMEAAFQLTLRVLRDNGNQNPSALDAGQFLFETFPNEPPAMRFFADYYDERVKAFHPRTDRLGTFAFPPMNADDFYGLRAGLIAMFQFLITKEQWYTLWE